jgi:hypothetical protein
MVCCVLLRCMLILPFYVRASQVLFSFWVLCYYFLGNLIVCLSLHEIFPYFTLHKREIIGVLHLSKDR